MLRLCVRGVHRVAGPSLPSGVIPEIQAMHDTLQMWRHDIHRFPETAYDEFRTSALVAEKLTSWGMSVTAFAKTGLVATLAGKFPAPELPSKHHLRSIGLRADMDALPMAEETNKSYQSMTSGRFHGCGHDGHVTMLLAAAKYLSETRNFAGTVNFIFQPAEEGEGGASKMVSEGLFSRFPCDAVFGIHNWPSLPEGVILAKAGPLMASVNDFDISVTGKGGHAAFPHLCVDPIVVASQLILGIQNIVSRETNPNHAAVISVTQVHGGTAYNVIPKTVKLTGTIRCFNQDTRQQLVARLQDVCEGVGRASRASIACAVTDGTPAVINHPAEADMAAKVGRLVVGEKNVLTDYEPSMAAEDFADFLNEVPGCFIWLGHGGPHNLHHPMYDFNDSILPIGGSWFARLAETLMPTPQHERRH